MADQPIDRVQVPSRRKDGTPDQTDTYEIIGDKDTAKAAIAEQLGQMKVSAADDVRAREQAAGNAGEGPSLSPEEQARKDEYDALLAEGEAEAESEVEANWVDPAPAERQSTVETTTRRGRRSSTPTE